MMSALKIAVVGSGYVGLVSGACLAEFGHVVTCVDRDLARVATLRQSIVPIFEPGLEDLIAKGTGEDRLSFTHELAPAIEDADVVLIAVGTPPRPIDGFADLSSVLEAAREIARHIRGFTVVAIKSTVPVGTGDEVERVIRAANPEADFAVVSNPEFLREGSAIEDFYKPDRIVIGAGDERALEIMRRVYLPLMSAGTRVLATARRTSELIKYATNAFLALKLTYINELADLCETLGVDVLDVAAGLGADSRVGDRFLSPGPGFGGSCFPKDALALVKTAQDAATPLRLIETMLAVNDVRRRAMARKVIRAIRGSPRGCRIAVLGVTFKPDTDDVRESPALSLIQALLDAGCHVTAFDPQGMENAKKVAPGIEWAADPYDCILGARAVVVATEWAEFRSLDFKRAATLMADLVVVDLRNVYPPGSLTHLGFRHVSVGRSEAGLGLLPVEAAA